MLKGAEKRMIVVRTRDSRMFEEAYFVVRPEAERSAREEGDMLREANRILENSLAGMRREELPRTGGWRLRIRGWGWFLGGLVSGGGIASLLWVLL